MDFGNGENVSRYCLLELIISFRWEIVYIIIIMIRHHQILPQ